jgi:putative NIF3 family GTP cyclohydrolase 1 type 2
MNVREIVDRILKVNGGKKFEKTCDQLIEGSWDQQVTGIVTTFMATIEVIRKTIDSGCNLIITHEPTYFTGSDDCEWLAADPVYQEKKTLINKNRISIWRYHDHMHHGNKDLIYTGLVKELGWMDYLVKKLPEPHCYSIPVTSLAELIEFLKKTLGLKVVRVIGNPGMKCSRVGILVGAMSQGMDKENTPAKLMFEQKLDVMICGDIAEWTLSAYVRDAAAMGLNKAMVVVGHERSEESGMKEMAVWLQPLTGGIPVITIDSGEPFVYY